MELSYWQSRWKKGHTGFHMPGGYPGLRNHWHALNISPEAHVLVPLCGKTPDMAWLAAQTKKVTGVEISEQALEEFIAEQNLTAERDQFAGFILFKTSKIDLWCGDFFKLPEHKFAGIDLIYDKAALVALPGSMRSRYAEKIISLCSPSTKTLLHHFTYPRHEMNGPPFSVSPTEIQELFGKKFKIRTLHESNLQVTDYQKFLKRGLKSYFIEYLLLLSPKADN